MECIIPSNCNPTTSSRTNKKSKVLQKGTTVKKKNKGVMKLSTDPQSVAARERRHRISDRFKILQSMVPGGSKMDTVSMLEEAIRYVKFLKTQILLHQTMINFVDVVDHDESSSFMLLPDEQINVSLLQQQNPSSVSVDSHSLHTLPQLPLDQCCFQGEEDTINTTFDAKYMKYWQA